MTSQHTDNSIFENQNAEILLRCQLAQRKKYSYAKTLCGWKLAGVIILVIVTIWSAVVDCETLSAFTTAVSVFLILFSSWSAKAIQKQKKQSALIQQYIDATLYSKVLGGEIEEWGDMPTDSEIASAISEADDLDISKVKNWYSDYSEHDGISQVFYCQSENIRWNCELYKNFRSTIGILGGIMIIAVAIIMIIKNPVFHKFLLIVLWILPLIEYIWTVYQETSDAISALSNLENEKNDIENRLISNDMQKNKKEIIKLQYQIWERRKEGFLIPDWFYSLYRKRQQKKEDNIAKNICKLKNGDDI